MATGNAVITGKIGPGITNTAVTIADVKSFDMNYETMILTVRSGNPLRTQRWDVTTDTTYTLVLTSGNFVLTVS